MSYQKDSSAGGSNPSGSYANPGHSGGSIPNGSVGGSNGSSNSNTFEANLAQPYHSYNK